MQEPHNWTYVAMWRKVMAERDWISLFFLFNDTFSSSDHTTQNAIREKNELERICKETATAY
jgi:hypothetical protein